MKTMKTNLISKVLDVSEYSTKFHVWRFFRIFIYHLFFWYLRPLITVPIISIFDSFAISKNMGFMIGSKDKFSFVTQNIQFLITAFMVIF
jgi:hypothetical protein